MKDRNEKKDPQKNDSYEKDSQKQDIKESRDEYSFVQETIKDQDKKQKGKKDITRVIILGLVFGVVASTTFCVTKAWLDGRLKNGKVIVEIPKEESENDDDSSVEGQGSDTDETKQAEEQSQEKQDELTVDSYRQLQTSLTEVGNEASKSVVDILCIEEGENLTSSNYDEKNDTAGLIVADNGKELLIFGKTEIITDSRPIRITFCDGTVAEATLKKKDGSLGFGIYGVKQEDISDSTWNKIQVATLGTTSGAMKGDAIIVLGNPFGYSGAMGFGTVSTNKNTVTKADGVYRLICTDIGAATNGSGIMVNADGEVVGIIDQSVSDQSSMNLVTGYGISDLKKIIEALSNGQSIPYIGIRGITVTEEIEAQGVPKGVYVQETMADAPAMEAGIRSGDVITAIGDTEIDSMEDYRRALLKLSVGDKVKISGKSKGTNGYVNVKFTVTVGEK